MLMLSLIRSNAPEFLKAKCLMNCEVARILDHKYEQLQQMSDDPSNQISQWVSLVLMFSILSLHPLPQLSFIGIYTI